MLIKGIIDEDFVNYKVPSMTINTNTCTFKCDKESGGKYCQNSELAIAPAIDISTEALILRYLRNDITKAVCFAGLEPLDQFLEVNDFIFTLRRKYKCSDVVVIYTGYNKDEIQGELEALKKSENIIVKFGRYVPNKEKHYDEVLGVYLASPNQYAEVIS